MRLTAHQVEDGRHPDRVARDTRRREYILDDLGEGREEQLADVLDIDLRGGRDVEEGREEVEKDEDEGVRRCDGGEVDGLEEDDEFGESFGARGDVPTSTVSMIRVGL
jgi:hypothetical protein